MEKYCFLSIFREIMMNVCIKNDAFSLFFENDEFCRELAMSTEAPAVDAATVFDFPFTNAEFCTTSKLK